MYYSQFIRFSHVSPKSWHLVLHEQDTCSQGAQQLFLAFYGAGWQTDVCMYTIYNVSWGVTPKPIAWTGTYRVALSCSCQCAVGPNKRPEVLGDPFFWNINKYHPPSTNETDQTMKMVVPGFYSPYNENWYIRWSCTPLLGSIIADYTPKDWAICEKSQWKLWDYQHRTNCSGEMITCCNTSQVSWVDCLHHECLKPCDVARLHADVGKPWVP